VTGTVTVVATASRGGEVSDQPSYTKSNTTTTQRSQYTPTLIQSPAISTETQYISGSPVITVITSFPPATTSRSTTVEIHTITEILSGAVISARPHSLQTEKPGVSNAAKSNFNSGLYSSNLPCLLAILTALFFLTP